MGIVEWILWCSLFLCMSLLSSDGIGTALWTGQSSAWGKIFSFSQQVCRLVLGPTQSPVQGVPGAVTLEAKRLGREASHSALFSKLRKSGGVLSHMFLWQVQGHILLVCMSLSSPSQLCCIFFLNIDIDFSVYIGVLFLRRNAWK